MNETKQKLIIYRSISDENSHFPQEFNGYMCDYIKNCNLVSGVPGLGQAEQYCTLIVHMLSCLFSTSDASLASVEVWRVEYSTR
jgi:hypothetical protein